MNDMENADHVQQEQASSRDDWQPFGGSHDSNLAEDHAGERKDLKRVVESFFFRGSDGFSLSGSAH